VLLLSHEIKGFGSGRANMKLLRKSNDLSEYWV